MIFASIEASVFFLQGLCLDDLLVEYSQTSLNLIETDSPIDCSRDPRVIRAEYYAEILQQ